MSTDSVDTVENAAASPDVEQPFAELGLKADEYARIRELLGRRPSAAVGPPTLPSATRSTPEPPAAR